MIEIGKVKISKEKLMKNEEMTSLRGGTNCWCWNQDNTVCATGTAPSYEVCLEMCRAAGCNGDATIT